MIHDQVKPDIVQVNLLHLLIKLGPLQHLQGVAVDVEHSVRLDLCVATLHDRLLALIHKPLTQLFLVQAIYLFLPLLLDDLDHVTLVFRLEHWQVNLHRSLFVHFGLGWAVQRLASGHLFLRHDHFLGLVQILHLLCRLDPLAVVRVDLRREEAAPATARRGGNHLLTADQSALLVRKLLVWGA